MWEIDKTDNFHSQYTFLTDLRFWKFRWGEYIQLFFFFFFYSIPHNV